MTGLSHAVTGVFLVVAIKEPAVALPAAFLSHFVIDALPHYDHKDLMPKPGLYKTVLISDAVLSIGVLMFFVLTLNEPAWLIFAGGLLGIAPDLMWFPAVVEGKVAPKNKNNILHLIRRFHAWIQWYEGPKGLYVEAVWIILMVAAIWSIGR